jgi:hypothetical protein
MKTKKLCVFSTALVGLLIMPSANAQVFQGLENCIVGQKCESTVENNGVRPFDITQMVRGKAYQCEFQVQKGGAVKVKGQNYDIGEITFKGAPEKSPRIIANNIPGDPVVLKLEFKKETPVGESKFVFQCLEVP